MSGCSIPNCEAKVYSRGLCLSHYNKIRNKVRKTVKMRGLKQKRCKICNKKIDILDHGMAKYCKEHRGFTKDTKKRYFKNMKEAEERSKWKRAKINQIKEKYSKTFEDTENTKEKIGYSILDIENIE